MPTADIDFATLALQGDMASFCPSCHAPMTRYDEETKRVWMRLAVEAAGEAQEVLMDPRLEGCERADAAFWPVGAVADDVRCPHCGTSLVDDDSTCDLCGSTTFSIEVSLHTRVAPLSWCTRSGCCWYGVPKHTRAKVRAGTPRQKKPEQDAELRIRNYNEVSYGFDTALATLEATRCLQCKKPDCVHGCPVEVDIPGFIKLIAEGDFAHAAQHIRHKNALPAVCGRVCPQDDQCEKACILGKKGEPVAIGALERFVADYERETDQVKLPRRAKHNGLRVAVVGSGPAGLTMAADLAVKGYAVTVYEALHSPGGVLVYGIPEFRLPKAIVEAETGNLRRLGVRFEVNSIIGKLYGLTELLDMGYDAVYVATGAGLPGFMGLPGENLCNIVSANEYLTRINLMKAYRFPEYDTPAPRGTTVAVVGGGNVAMDCARTALRMGARDVTLVYRRTRSEMPARTEEIEHAEQEGLRFEYLTSPVAYEGDEQGWVQQHALRPDEARRARCVRAPAPRGGARLGLPDRRRHGHRRRRRRPQQSSLRGRQWTGAHRPWLHQGLHRRRPHERAASVGRRRHRHRRRDRHPGDGRRPQSGQRHARLLQRRRRRPMAEARGLSRIPPT